MGQSGVLPARLFAAFKPRIWLFKAGYLVVLPLVFAWITVVEPFLRNGMPTGWDSGAYIAWANSFDFGGFSYVQDPKFIQFSGLNLIPLLLLFATIKLTGSTLVGYVTFQLLILAFFFLSTFTLSQALSRSTVHSMLVFSFLVTSFAFIRMAKDLYANLLTLAFLQMALAGSVQMRSTAALAIALATYSFSALMLFTGIEIGTFGIVVLIAAVLVSLVRDTLSGSEVRRLLAPFGASLITASVLWFPFASTYLPISSAIVAAAGSPDRSTIFEELGGLVLVPVWIAGVAFAFLEFKQKRRNVSSAIIVTWFATSAALVVALLVLRPPLALRATLLVPIYFLLPEATKLVSRVYHYLNHLKRYGKPMALIIISFLSIVISAYSISVFASQTDADKTSPFLPQKEYRTLTQIGNYLRSNQLASSSTVFLLFPSQRISKPQAVGIWTNLYDNWIFATVGPHLTYYGTLENFTQHVPISFVSTDEEKTYRFYSNLFASEAPGPKLNMVIVSFLYVGNQLGLTQLTQPVADVYLREVDLSQVRSNSWMPSYYALSQSGGYFASANWSFSGFVLESYVSTPANASTNFQVIFSMYLEYGGNHSLNARMYDYSPSNSPILVSIDGHNRFAFNYYGTLSPKIFSGDLGGLAPGYHTVVLQTLEGMPHNIDLDAVRLSNSTQFGLVSPSTLTSTWSVVDGAGTATTATQRGITMVAGTAGQNGILGVRTAFPQPLNLNGSLFLFFYLNSDRLGTISVWIVDYGQNTVRYDVRYYALNRMQLVVIPIALAPYSFISSTPPDLTSIVSLEIGMDLSGQVGLDYQFTSLVLVVNPIPISYLQ